MKSLFPALMLCGVMSFGQTNSAPKKAASQKWYITGGQRATQTDCEVEPAITHGKDRLDAIANSGMTVWSEAEWKASNPAAFRESCKVEHERKAALEPLDGVAGWPPSDKPKSVSPKFSPTIGGMYCCTDEQMGTPSCPDGYQYVRLPGMPNGSCDLSPTLDPKKAADNLTLGVIATTDHFDFPAQEAVHCSDTDQLCLKRKADELRDALNGSQIGDIDPTVVKKGCNPGEDEGCEQGKPPILFQESHVFDEPYWNVTCHPDPTTPINGIVRCDPKQGITISTPTQTITITPK
jgi:hypothetical protein